MNNNELSSLPLTERRRLLELAKSAKLTRQTTQKTEITPREQDSGVPLSWAQQRLWFLAQLDPAAQTAYHMSAGLELTGKLNLAALQAALDRVVARHEILRTTIVMVEDEAQQIVGDADCGFSLTIEDFSQLSSEEQQAAIEETAYLEANQPFDFANGPLLRGRLLKLAEDKHILLLTQHHIISDGWSVAVLMQELSTLYHAFSQGQPDPLPPLTIQYADYVVWQKKWLQGETLEKQINFWRDTLQGAPALLELPTDRPRPAKQSYAGGRIDLALPAQLQAGLKDLSQRHGTTLFMTLLAGWATLLSRLSGQDDIVIGTPVANRQQPALASLIGFFVNTLALRVQLHDNPTVSELLAQVKQQALNAYAHQDLPFEQLVETLQPSRSLSHSPVFQVMLATNNTPGQRHFALPGLTLEERPLIRESSYFDLTLTLDETENGLTGDLEYASDLFDHATIERMVSHLYTLLAAMVADDTQSVAELPLMEPQQRKQLLVDFNNSALTHSQDSLIHQLFEQQAESQPDAVALVYQDSQLSYAELNQRANQLAHSLIAFGIRPDDRIALCVDRSLDMIIGMLGILKAGAGYVPCDPEYPAERLAYQLSDSKPALMLTQQHLQAQLPETDVPVWLLDGDSHQKVLAQQPIHNPDASLLGLQTHHLAYIIYTSGSTGLPKGVMLEHRNVVNFIHSHYQISHPQPEDRILQFATMAFDTSVSDIFPTLSAGATLVLRPAHIRVPDAEFIHFLEQQKITIIDLPTAFWHQWVQEMKAGRVGFSLHLRIIIVGGEKAEYRHLADWQSLPVTQNCTWINTYGPTETTVTATNLILDDKAFDSLNGSIPIGYPNTNSPIYILDTLGQLVPIGVSGEIHIGGDSVARGYLNREELTAERFVSDPFREKANSRMYKSGDLGRWLPNGTIEYLGRNDFQVKIRGFRIELGEIETQLAACEGVKDVVVVAREETGGDKRLVAYLIPQPGTVLSPAHLREQLSTYLMEHMIPSAFVMLEEFPLTGSGKIDRKALPEPDRSAIASREYEAPQGEIEQKLAEVWQSLLGLEQVGRHDNFFELGGHSLLTVQMASRVRQALNIKVDLQSLFTHPILSDLAQSLSAQSLTVQAQAAVGHAEDLPEQPVILPASRQQVLPLSWPQQRLWFLAQLDSAAQTAYHISGGLRLKGKLNQSALQATLDRIIARHEILRTTIKVVDGVAQQIIAEADRGFDLTIKDLSQLNEAEKQAAIDETAQYESNQPFDFALDPLIRGQLLKLSDDEHVMLLTQHHMISDGWSLNILMYELTAIYQAFNQGQADPLPALKVQYADYALWQRQWLQGESLEKQVNFWRDALQGAPALLELPTDKVRPEVQSYRGDQVAFTLSPELSQGLKALSQRHSSTLFMTLMAAWSILLSRISGQQDIVIGAPVANRQHSELEPLIGFFANTLAMRVKLEGNPTVATLLAQVKTHAQAAYVHQDLPFEQLVEALKPPRSLSHSPIFQVMLALDNTPVQQSLELADLMLDELPSTRQSTHFDLSLSMTDTDNGLVGELEYASDLFEHATVERFAGYLQTLLAAMVEDDSLPVENLPLLQPQQREQLLVEFNDTALSYQQNVLIHQLFEQQAERTPDATALIFGESQMSYAELNRHANQLANYLIVSGIRPDDRVAICVDRSLEMIIGMYAILKAGAGYVPLDPEYPAERLAYQLSDSKPALLLTQRHLQDRLPGQNTPFLLLDDDDHRIAMAQQPTHNPDAQQMGLLPHHLAYIIYTSGSTGQPKGVMLEHRNVVNFIHAQHQTSEPQPGDRILQFATVAFDTSVSDIFPTLASGATLVLRPPHIRIPDMEFVSFLRDQQITIMDMPTAFWHHWVQEMMAGRSGFSPYLHTIIVGGEKAEYRHLMNWLSSPETRACRWVNSYGPTEATVIATTLSLDALSLNHRAQNSDAPLNIELIAPKNNIPIGYPLPNTAIYILDAHGQPVPLGVCGEIHIGGAGIARGYLNRPEMTAEKFVADPFSNQPNARMYKTGDLGCRLPNGTIEYLGRNDFQVKIRGFRIELGEIEARLVQCHGVQEAIVVAREMGLHADLLQQQTPGEKRLVAYVIPKTGAELTPATLRQQLTQHLADYMIPSAFVTLGAFPLTPNGKIDRNALPEPDQSAAVTRDYEAPIGDMEITLAEIWQTLLGLEKVGRSDHFFELGGHSLLAVQFAASVRQKLGLELPLQQLFAHPVLADLATALNNASVATQTFIPVADRNQPLPLSFAQQRLWFLAQLEPAASLAYHIPAVLSLKGQLDHTAFTATLNRLVARQESLRTRFVLVDEQPSQQIDAADTGFALTYQDFRSLDAVTQQHQLTELIEQDMNSPFDFINGPLIRGQLLQLADDEHTLILTQHHIISDGWSVGVLIRELGEIYRSALAGQGDPLPPLPIQYADYAVWQRGWLQGDVLESQRNFWVNQLQDAPALLTLPTDYPRPAVQSYAGGQVAVSLDADLLVSLKALCQREGTTLFMTLLAAWGIVLARISGQEDIVIGTPVANRPRNEFSDLIGFFVNTLPLRVKPEHGQTVAELLAHVREQALAAYAHQDLPFEQLVETLQPERSLSYSPIFQVMLALDNTPVQDIELPGLSVSVVEQNYRSAHFDLTLSLSESMAGLHGTLEYASDLFEHATVERMAGYLRNVLAAMVHDADKTVANLPILSASERQQVLFDFNATQADFPRDALIHQLFEAYAAQHPDATSLIYENQTMSYGELNQRANRLAHHLIALGVRPDDRVAISAERSPEMVVGLLAILKAGGAYVPIDPTYPAERLAYMLGDAAPVVLLTQTAWVETLVNALPSTQPVTGEAVSATNMPILVLDDCEALMESQPTHNPDSQALGLTSRHMAYIIYTSGSTGKPKGVMIEHRNVLRLIINSGFADIGPDDCVAHSSNISFDAATWEVWVSLVHGARLLLLPEKALLETAAFGQRLSSEGVSALFLTTSLFNQYASLLAPALSGLRYVIFGGEQADPRPVMSLRTNYPPKALLQAYGPTETTTYATIYEVPLTRSNSGKIPIGRPIGNTQIYILDPQSQPVPLGVTGEMYISGDGVARGYLNRPDLTDERFLADPFSDNQEARMYKTGDLARWLPDGNIEYIARNDFQVKLRGFRIELGEIESRLVECHGVRDAVVLAREDEPGQKRLVAYLIAEDGIELEPASLRQELSQHLTEYMLPSAFVMLDVFPLMPNGKLNRQALPAPDQTAIAMRSYEAPVNEQERVLAEVWQALLGLEQVGRHDHFFELGGHSLMIVSLLERLRNQGWSIDIRTVFSTPVLAEMAKAISISPDSTDDFIAPPNLIPDGCTAITPDMLPLVSLPQNEIDLVTAAIPGGAANIQDIYPLAPLQEGILYHYLLETLGDTYLLRTQFVFDSRERLDAFLTALQQVINRHDILRTSAYWQGLALPVQIVHRHASLPVIEHTLSVEESAEAQLSRLTDSRAMRMDLTQAPLLAAHIAQDHESGHWLLSLLNHHLVCDHLSLELISNEVKTLLLGEDDSLPAPQPYRNFIAQTRSIAPEVHQAYFQQLLGDVDEPTLPFGLHEVQNSNQDEIQHKEIAEDILTLDSELANNLRDCARQQGMSVAVLFHVAWAQVLARCSGRDDVVFGTVLLGRLQGGAGASQALGMFINTLPVRVQLQARNVLQVVQETNQQLTELLNHEQAPLAVAQRCSGIQAPMPLFSSLLNFRHSPDDNTQSTLQAWEGIRVIGGEERSNYPLSLDVDSLTDGFSLVVQCYQQINPARLNAYMEIALKEIVAALQHAPEQSFDTMDILPQAERTQLLQDFNDTGLDYPQDMLIHQMFEQQVSRTPDMTALVSGDTELSYAELNRRANQLAHSLIAFGIRPDNHVALCVERSTDMIIAMFGILKAGANYVPLDPEYPSDRLAYQLSDSQPVLLLTQHHIQERLPSENIPVWLLDDDIFRGQVAQQPEHNPEPEQLGLGAHHLAYIIYTSGSTGQPKGVMIEHRNVVNFIHVQHQVSHPQPGDRILQFATVAFDTSVSDIFPTLAAGATLVLRPAHIRVPDQTFVDYLIQQKITIIDLPTAFWHHWVQEVKANRTGFSPYLTKIIVGGEKAELHHLQDWLSLPETQSCGWINSYGPTETTVIATNLVLNNYSSPITSAIPIGYPNVNTQIYILDTHGLPVPLGVSGEIHIAGFGVARGYLNRPDLTAEKFIADPFSTQPNARMYKTGDLGCWLPDGTIEYLGRNDFQVKIRGFRIELGEIEAQLLACTSVREALVVAREEDDGDKRLVAYVIPQPGTTLDVNDLREQLSNHLAGYMMPNAFVMLDAFPLTASGKVDRKALPAPDRTAIASHEYAAPEGVIEQQIAVILQTLLKLEQVGRYDSFFDLGGNSLSIIQLMARLRDEFHLEVSIQDIFAHSTLSELAELIASRQIETFFAQEDIELLQKELEDLSEDELRALLNGDN
ncbi:non-ribosomal peptide synthetase [Xenorhabdus santafensis]|nr:non-ribosomal peptide synthetase [Xenorhabdus sp. 12]